MPNGTLEHEWAPYSPCPCGCAVVAAKLQSRHDRHVVGCACPPCRGRRNRAKGRRAQARGYRKLGGSAPFTPGHEENSGTQSVEVQVEAKAGAQVPASFAKFAGLEWTRRAISQAERAIPVGVQANPAVYIEVPRKGAWLVVKL